MLSYTKLVEFVKAGYIKTPKDSPFTIDINSASIDVRIGNKILLESPAASTLELNRYNSKHLTQITIRDTGYLIRPGQVFLANSLEILELPNNIVAQFVLKSSIGKLFINQILSTHIEPGFKGNITLELLNWNEQHSIRITPFAKIGQFIFHEVEAVPEDYMYCNSVKDEEELLKSIES